jgi:UTP--glucose-1-phosphate uridylyltransferase
MIRKAIVPMAGLGTRLYPISVVLPKGLMPFVLPDGLLTTGLQLITHALLDAGVEQIGVVVSPENRSVYEAFLAGGCERYAAARATRPSLQQSYESLQRLRERICWIEQRDLWGLGHAVWCAREFAASEEVLVMLGDHIPIPLNPPTAITEVLALYAQHQAPVYGVHRVPLSKVSLYGILQGAPTETQGVYRLLRLREKPSPDEAREHLHTEVPQRRRILCAQRRLMPFRLRSGRFWSKLPPTTRLRTANGRSPARSNACWSACLRCSSRRRRRWTSAQRTSTDARSATSRGTAMYKSEFRYRGETLALTAQPEGEGWKVRLPDGTEFHIRRATASENMLTLHTDTGVVQLFFVRTAQGVELQYRGRVYRFQRVEPLAGGIPHSSAEGVLTAPMPGIITKVFVQQGDPVEAGQRLLVLEAMKTEQALRAPFAGVVARLNAREGDLVQEGTVLVEIRESRA